MSDGFEKMLQRATYNGYDIRDEWNVRDKYESFLEAKKNSYQAEWITFNDEKVRCLINPEKLKEDYDQKMISVDFDAGIRNGSTFLWDRTNTHWLVYLQDYGEEAYFRASIRRCDYEIDVNGHPYWVYTRGPVETALIWRQKHALEFNELNYSILLYVTRNEETNAFFKRFQILKFDGHNWRVAAVDRYSQDGLIEVYLEEYYDNEMEDLMIEPEVPEIDTMKPHIEGPQVVRPYDDSIAYSIVGVTGGEFSLNSTKAKITKTMNNSCIVTVTTGKSGSFVLCYKRENQDDITLDISIRSL